MADAQRMQQSDLVRRDKVRRQPWPLDGHLQVGIGSEAFWEEAAPFQVRRAAEFLPKREGKCRRIIRGDFMGRNIRKLT
jgi:hypothetical protein